MRLRSFLQCVLVVFACLASGTLECGGTERTVVARRGEQIYQGMCAVCHGVEGKGYAADEAPALSNHAFLAAVSDVFLRTAIANGRSGTTMSAWSRAHSGPLGGGDVDAIIAFLHDWQEGPRAVLDESPRTGDVARGAGVFAQECVRCHGPQGVGGPFVHIGDADFLATATDGFLRQAIREGRPGTAMAGFAASLGNARIEDVLSLVRSWPTKSVGISRPPPAKAPPLPLGPVPLNPQGPEPIGFRTSPQTTPGDVIKGQLLDRHARMAVLDARAPSDYLNEHIAGAVSVPFYDPDPYLSQLPKDAWLVCYCACPHAESGTLAQKLTAHGFTKVTVLDEGLGVWRARKYPTHTGLDP